MWVFISSLCVNSVMIRSVFAIRKTHMGASQAAPPPSTSNSGAELRGRGDGPSTWVESTQGGSSLFRRRPRETAWGRVVKRGWEWDLRAEKRQQSTK